MFWRHPRNAFLPGDRPATLHGVVFDILVGALRGGGFWGGPDPNPASGAWEPSTTFSILPHCSIVRPNIAMREQPMTKLFGRLAGVLLALVLMSDLAAAQSKITIAVGGGACLCYLPTVLAKQLGEYDKAGLAVELVDLKGGSDALKAVLGGSADVVSGYF